jgi:hypothetical protein
VESYNGEQCPLLKILENDSDFFALFKDFKEYVDFFFLQDIVSIDYEHVKSLSCNDGYCDDFFLSESEKVIPQTVEDYFLVLGFWPTKIQKNEIYTRIARSVLEHYSNYIKNYKTIITGDFNLYHKVSQVNKAADILSINEFLNSLGLSSVYHAKTGEAFGAESQATYFHLFKKESPFFLDYTYSNFPIPMEAYRLLDWKKEFSDHVGQVFDV